MRLRRLQILTLIAIFLLVACPLLGQPRIKQVRIKATPKIGRALYGGVTKPILTNPSLHYSSSTIKGVPISVILKEGKTPPESFKNPPTLLPPNKGNLVFPACHEDFPFLRGEPYNTETHFLNKQDTYYVPQSHINRMMENFRFIEESDSVGFIYMFEHNEYVCYAA